MPRPRIAMRKIREVLRLALGEELSRRQVSAASGIPLTTVHDYLRRAASAGLVAAPRRLDDTAWSSCSSAAGPAAIDGARRCRTGAASIPSCAGRA